MRRVGVAALSGMSGERGAQVVTHRQAGKHVRAAYLHDAFPGARLGREVGDRLVEETHDTPIREPEPADHPQQGGLARAVRAEDGERLTAADVEVHVEQDLYRAVAEVEVAHLEQRHLRSAAFLVGTRAFFLELLDHATHVAFGEARSVRA